jgi:Fe-S-cluster-containing hydrogenase component 2
MLRQVIKIDEEKCNGCGLCSKACHEGAIAMVEGKARLIRDDFCDGLGNCLPVCPTGAITFEERDAAAFDETAVKTYHENKSSHHATGGGCPGSRMRTVERQEAPEGSPICAAAAHSELRQWPIQLKLVPANAPYFQNAKLLIAADCTAFAHGSFHQTFMKNHVTLIGCPKLDSVDYTQKLTDILKKNDIQSIKVVRMEVPCCGGIEYAVKEALKASGKWIPWQVVVLSTNGEVLCE